MPKGKDTYVIEVSDPDATVAVSTYRVTITVMDVNDPPTAPSGAEGPAAGAEHRSDVRSNLYLA